MAFGLAEAKPAASLFDCCRDSVRRCGPQEKEWRGAAHGGSAMAVWSGVMPSHCGPPPFARLAAL